MEFTAQYAFPEKDFSRYTSEADRMLATGLAFVRAVPDTSTMEKPTFKEYAVGSTLHRGYYHPSPVYDLIVGNTKRGRLIRNPITTNTSHCYYYDDQRRLFRVDSLFQGRVAYTEYLYADEQTVYGITVDCNGRLAAVCREIYENGQIVALRLMRCVCMHGQYECFEYLEEHYCYDVEGLCACNYVVYRPRSEYGIYEVYEFLRENGRLVSYVNITKPDRHYLIPKRKQRKA